MFFVIFLLLVAVIGLTIFTLYSLTRKNILIHRPENAPSPENRRYLNPEKTTIVCIGDSNTHGNVSYNWVEDLVEEFPHYQILNAGVNADLTYTLLERLDDSIACQPHYITLLIGTNDVQATMSKEQESTYRTMKKIGENNKPSFEGFCENYTQIVHRLRTETKAKIALMSLPVLSEDLRSEVNAKADKYSDFIKTFAEKEGLTYLPLREQQKKYLEENPSQTTFRYEDTKKVMGLAIMKHTLWGRDWDKISQEHGFQLTTDNVHQNAISGNMIKDLVRGFIAPH